jgi:DNA-binding response OmpR family regulator
MPTHADAPTVLVVEDDPATRAFLASELDADGFVVVTAGSVAQGRAQLAAHFPDVVVCDVGLPDGSGLGLLGAVRDGDSQGRRIDPRTPVLLLTGRAGEVDRLRGFERGADDYVVKPFSYGELLARIRAVLRRTQERPGRSVLRAGPIEVDPVRREVRVDGELVPLAAKEYGLLLVLVREPTRVFTKAELLRAVWGTPRGERTRTLDSHACRLRQKLAGAGERFVVNVWGVGYRLTDAEHLEAAA